MRRRSKLTHRELWACLSEADARRSNGNLPIDVRVRSFETYAICLREAANRGLGYETLRDAAAGATT
jgi:hypothetical protein